MTAKEHLERCLHQIFALFVRLTTFPVWNYWESILRKHYLARPHRKTRIFNP
jgi:hypothetical protein